MIHVPSRYSGGVSQEVASWTQTRQEIEVRVPVPYHLVGASVRCSIEAQRYSLYWEGSGAGEKLRLNEVGGVLSAVVVMDNSLWSVETEGEKRTAVISLRKAVPGLWHRLLAADPAVEDPKLLDGLERAQPRSKDELLKDAKARAGAALTGPSKAKPHSIEDREGECIELSPAVLPDLPVLAIRRCSDCTIVLASSLSVVKLAMEGCTRVGVTVNGKVLTETLEAWRCENCAVHIATRLATLQVDACRGLHFFYQQSAHFEQMVSAGVYAASLAFGDAPSCGGVADLNALRASMPDKGLSEETDQFITRVVDGALLTELIIRLSNDYPTTEREAADFAKRTSVNGEKLDEAVGGMLSSGVGGKLDEAERQRVLALMREQAEHAASAQAQSEQSAEVRHAARVGFKKTAGNEAFKASEYQQAAVLYTEALSLCTIDAVRDEEALIRCNRAACFLKLGRYAQAREDAEACVAIKPEHAKGHFRLALALQAEERFGDACHAFNRVLTLEPKNKDAASGLRMAEVQAERRRRMEAA